jgi:hypothetical protein
MASTLVALVRMAGATMNASTANGLCINEFGPMVPFQMEFSPNATGSFLHEHLVGVARFAASILPACRHASLD